MASLEDFNSYVYETTKKYHGTGYDYGNKNPDSGGVDCSGWVSRLFTDAGVPLKGSAAELAETAFNRGKLSTGSKVGPGELVFSSGQKHAEKRWGGVGHVGITVQDPKTGQLYVSEARSSSGVSLTPIAEWYERFPQSQNAPVMDTVEAGKRPTYKLPNIPGKQFIGRAIEDLAQRGVNVYQTADTIAQKAVSPIYRLADVLTGRDISGEAQRQNVQKYDRIQRSVPQFEGYGTGTWDKIQQMAGSFAPLAAEMAALYPLGGTAASGFTNPIMKHLMQQTVPWALEGAINTPEDPGKGVTHGAGIGSLFAAAPGGRIVHPLAMGAIGTGLSAYQNPEAEMEDHLLSGGFMGLLGALGQLKGGGTGRNPLYQGKNWRPSAESTPRLQDVMPPPPPDAGSVGGAAASGLRYGERYGPVEQSRYSPYGEVSDAAAPGVTDMLQAQRAESIRRNFQQGPAQANVPPATVEYGPGRGDTLYNELPRWRGSSFSDMPPEDVVRLEAQLSGQQRESVARRMGQTPALQEGLRYAPESGPIDVPLQESPGWQQNVTRENLGAYQHMRMGEPSSKVAPPPAGPAGRKPPWISQEEWDNALANWRADDAAKATAKNQAVINSPKHETPAKDPLFGQLVTAVDTKNIPEAYHIMRDMAQVYDKQSMLHAIDSGTLLTKLTELELGRVGEKNLQIKGVLGKQKTISALLDKAAAGEPMPQTWQEWHVVEKVVQNAKGQPRTVKELVPRFVEYTKDGYNVYGIPVEETNATTIRAGNAPGAEVPGPVSPETPVAPVEGEVAAAQGRPADAAANKVKKGKKTAIETQVEDAITAEQQVADSQLPPAPPNMVAERVVPGAGVIDKKTGKVKSVTPDRVCRYTIEQHPQDPKTIIMRRSDHDAETGGLVNDGPIFSATSVEELAGKIARSNDPGLKMNLDKREAGRILQQMDPKADLQYFYSGLPLPVPERVYKAIDNMWNHLKQWNMPDDKGPLAGFTEKDMWRATKFLRLPYWVAKQHPEFARYRDIVFGWMERKQQVWGDCVQKAELFMLDPQGRLDPQMRLNVERALLAGDQLGCRVRNLPEAEAQSTLQQWRQQLEATLHPTEYEAYMGVRDALDHLHKEVRTTLSDAGLKDSEVSKILRSAGFQFEYFPHRWAKGKFYAIAHDPQTGEPIMRSTANSKTELRDLYRDMQARYGAENVKWGKNVNMPEETFMHINPEHSARIAQAAVDRLEGLTPARKAEIFTAIGDTIRGRGFGQHFISRSNAQGFEMTNLRDVLNQTFHGGGGYLGKIQAAPELYRMVNWIDANKKPNLYAYGDKLVGDLLKNTSNFEQGVRYLRAAAFHWYLGANVKSAAVNLSQNLTTFAPYMSKYSKGMKRKVGAGMKDIAADYEAYKTLRDGGGPANFKTLTAEENQAMTDLFRTGAFNSMLMEEMSGALANQVTGITNDVLKASGWLFGNAEHYNRMGAGLTAYRVFRQEMGKPHEVAVTMARDAIFDTHFAIGKFNLPEFARGSDFGALVRSTGYQFKNFVHNYVELMAHMARDNKKGFAQAAATMAVLGGAGAVPIVRELLDGYKAWTGEDPLNALDKDSALYTFSRFGLPGFAGVDVSGSLALDVIPRGDTLGDTALSIIFGPAYGVAEQMQKAYKHNQLGSSNLRIVEEMAPTAPRNFMRAYREAHGITNMRGQEVWNPNTFQQEKLSPGEALAQGLSFRPTSTAMRMDADQQLRRAEGTHRDVQDSLASRFTSALKRGDSAEISAVIGEVEKYNALATAQGKPPIDLQKSIENRMKPAVVKKRWWEYRSNLGTGG